MVQKRERKRKSLSSAVSGLRRRQEREEEECRCCLLPRCKGFPCLKWKAAYPYIGKGANRRKDRNESLKGIYAQ